MVKLRARGRRVPLDRPLVMAVLNVNSDSFSDPGPRTTAKLVDQAVRFAADGASMIDVGAQSSVTNRDPVPAGTEAAAIRPVVREIVQALPDVLVSVDTFKADVARAALDEGAHIINDVSGLREPRIAQLCSQYGAALVVMHTSAPPLTRLQDSALYSNVTAEVAEYLERRSQLAGAIGVDDESIILDPGPDFTKTPAQTIEMLRSASSLARLKKPILLALSRKDFVGALTQRPPADRTAGTLGAIAALRHVPNQILRVHDVRSTVDMLEVFDALSGEIPIPADLALSDELRHQPRWPRHTA